MLSTTADWFRLLTPFPNDEQLRLRRSSANRIAQAMVTMKAADVLDMVSLAVETFDSERKDNNPALTTVLERMLEDEPSMDRQQETEGLGPRICAALGLCAFMDDAGGAARRRTNVALAAGAVASAMRFRPIASGGYAADRVRALLGFSEKSLEAIDARRRSRKDTAMSRFGKTRTEATLDVLDAVGKLVSGLNEEMLKDREELQAMWWLLGDHSHHAKRSFTTLSAGTAAVFAGIELAEIVQPPATRGMCALAERVSRTTPAGEDETDLIELLDSIEPQAWMTLQSPPGGSERVVRNPTLFPITALSLSYKSAGWAIADAITKSCSLGADARFTAASLAAQVFAERSLLNASQGG